ncbi:hypothetical protein K504DRAFT_307503 [Pleomassaria siparia CBS 279.74]|uniref:Uncharacterized protein n=1 Tax=Pleomassaria siparia CBS 279.74 TaxID=1314801 RepID=A0A6G1K6L0_9PLEO|nr:hypothetical protein K504DRAFT_307503 [Pleomassaria siparia CBS 279.74]
MPLFKHGKDKSSSHAPKEKQTTPGPTRSDPEPQSFNPDVPSLVTPKQNVSNVEAASSKAQNPDTRRPGVSIPDSRRVDARTNSALGVEGLVEDINNSTNFDFGLKTPTTHENLTAQGAIGVGRQQLSSSDTEGIDPPGRRDNPTNAMRKTLTKAPTSSLHDSYKILARLSDGTPLYRL